MKKQSSIEFLLEKLTYDNGYGQRCVSFIETVDLTPYFEQAKEMEKTEKAKHTLFIGKVVDEIGFERTNELLIEVKNAFGE